MGLKDIIEREFSGPNRESTMVRPRPARVHHLRPRVAIAAVQIVVRRTADPPRPRAHPPVPLPLRNLLRAAGLFVGAIVFMRNFGDQMAI